MIFDEATIQKLTRLTLVAEGVRAGVMKGERRSTKRGTSIEFADFRDYTPGDDLRRVDWKAYARLDRPFLKLFEEEEDLAVHVLVDASASMDWGSGEANKFDYARRLAAALGAIALATGDQLSLAMVSGLSRGDTDANQAQFGPLRGRQNTLRMLQFLESQRSGGKTNLDQSLRRYALAAHRPGLAILISDLFSAEGFLDGLRQLQSRGHAVTVLHLLAPDEMDPPLAGDLRLVDVETGQAREVSVDAGLRDLYRRRVESWQEEIRAECRRRGARYLSANTAQPWESLVLLELRRAGVVQ